MKIIKDLFSKYTWEEIEPVLFRLYPTLKKNVVKYKEAYQKFTAVVPAKTSMRIFIEEHNDKDVGNWYELYGKDGTLVKEVPQFQNENAYQQLKDRWESEENYALSYVSWEEMAGTAIDQNTLSAFDEKDIVVHVLLEITLIWRTDEQDLKVLETFETILNAQEPNLKDKNIIDHSGCRRVWTEKDNGCCHGFYTIYWGNGVMRSQGIFVDGSLEGVWTSWDRNGKVISQTRYWCDRGMELKSESPWWNGVKDQNRT
jgi:hypothetical protein